jgi:hypothetical protein
MGDALEDVVEAWVRLTGDAADETQNASQEMGPSSDPVDDSMDENAMQYKGDSDANEEDEEGRKHRSRASIRNEESSPALKGIVFPEPLDGSLPPFENPCKISNQLILEQRVNMWNCRDEEFATSTNEMYVLVLESDATKKVFVHSAFIRTVSRLLQGKLGTNISDQVMEIHVYTLSKLTALHSHMHTTESPQRKLIYIYIYVYIYTHTYICGCLAQPQPAE